MIREDGNSISYGISTNTNGEADNFNFFYFLFFEHNIYEANY